ncbi:MAG: hypothetical protein ACJ74Z_21620, partial [Bryobacteraceae bacterium]
YAALPNLALQLQSVQQSLGIFIAESRPSESLKLTYPIARGSVLLTEPEQLLYSLLPQDVLRTFGGAVQGELLNLVERDAVGDWRMRQHVHIKLAS